MRLANRKQRALTLIEMMVVVALIGLIAGISFPAVTAGLDTLRLRQAGESIVSLFNTAIDRAERRQQPVEIVIDLTTNSIALAGASLERVVELPQGVRILTIAPPLAQGDVPQRRFVLFPGGAVPQFTMVLTNAKGTLRGVAVDPVTGMARMTTPAGGL